MWQLEIFPKVNITELQLFPFVLDKSASLVIGQVRLP